MKNDITSTKHYIVDLFFKGKFFFSMLKKKGFFQ